MEALIDVTFTADHVVFISTFWAVYFIGAVGTGIARLVCEIEHGWGFWEGILMAALTAAVWPFYLAYQIMGGGRP